MGYTGDFFDNVTYGADDINQIRRTVFAPGVMPDSGDSCKVVTAGSGSVKIMPGEAVFEDGSRIEVDTSGVSLNLISGQTNYVYFQRDTIENSATPEISTTQPSGSNTVPLATVSSTGAVTDTRTFAMLRVSNVAQPEYHSGSEDITGTLEANATVVKTIALPAGCKKVKFMVSGKFLAETGLEGMDCMIALNVAYSYPSPSVPSPGFFNRIFTSADAVDKTNELFGTYTAYKAFDSKGYIELTSCEMVPGQLRLSLHNYSSRNETKLDATIYWEAW